MTVALPKPFASAQAAIRAIASSADEAVELAAVHDRARARRRRPSSVAPSSVSPSGWITTRTGEPVLARELEVALVVGRHRHDRARAVAHEHEVADPDRDLLARERVDRVAAGEDAFLLDLALETRAAVLRAQARDRRCARPLRRRPGDQRRPPRVLGREHHEGRAVDGVDARGEDPDRLAALDREVHLGARASGPPSSAAACSTRSGQAASSLHVVEQLVLVGGDAEEPLLHLALLDRRCGSASTPRPRPARWRARSGRRGTS